MHRRLVKVSALASAVLVALVAPAFAHPGHGGASGGFADGFAHPFLGLDHVVAMLAVGLCAARFGTRTSWAVPMLLPPVIALGGAVGFRGIELPFTQMIIALTAVLLGGLIAARRQGPVVMVGAVIAAFGFAHGYAHSQALLAAADPAGFALGFFAATALLLLAGLLLGWFFALSMATRLARGLGVAIGLVGGLSMLAMLV